MSDELKKQVGGDHYKKHPVQPMAFNVINNIPWAEGEVLKYVVRWRDKGGVQDLKKAHHILGFLIEFHCGRLDKASFMEAIWKAEEEGVVNSKPYVDRAAEGTVCDICLHEATWIVGGVPLCGEHESLRKNNRIAFMQLLKGEK